MGLTEPEHSSSLVIDPTLIVGIDVGGTKVAIINNKDAGIRRYITADFPDLYAVLDRYFSELEALPASIAVGMAGPRDENSGEVHLTNGQWPPFNPHTASQRYKGLSFHAANDMVTVTHGALNEPTVEQLKLKSGRSTKTGTKTCPHTKHRHWGGRGGVG